MAVLAGVAFRRVRQLDRRPCRITRHHAGLPLGDRLPPHAAPPHIARVSLVPPDRPQAALVPRSAQYSHSAPPASLEEPVAPASDHPRANPPAPPPPRRLAAQGNWPRPPPRARGPSGPRRPLPVQLANRVQPSAEIRIVRQRVNLRRRQQRRHRAARHHVLPHAPIASCPVAHVLQIREYLQVRAFIRKRPPGERARSRRRPSRSPATSRVTRSRPAQAPTTNCRRPSRRESVE